MFESSLRKQDKRAAWELQSFLRGHDAGRACHHFVFYMPGRQLYRAKADFAPRLRALC